MRINIGDGAGEGVFLAAYTYAYENEHGEVKLGGFEAYFTYRNEAMTWLRHELDGVSALHGVLGYTGAVHEATSWSAIDGTYVYHAPPTN